MKTISQLKREASASLDGRWGKYAGVSLVYTLIAIAIVAIIIMVATIADGGVFDEHSPMYNILQIVAEILIVPLGWGYYMILLRNLRGQHDTANTANMFDGYRDFMRITFTMLLQGIYTFLWALLLIVPGIIKYYSYRMTMYVLHDNPELKYNGAIERSMQLMKGHKMKLFLLDPCSLFELEDGTLDPAAPRYPHLRHRASLGWPLLLRCKCRFLLQPA